MCVLGHLRQALPKCFSDVTDELTEDPVEPVDQPTVSAESVSSPSQTNKFYRVKLGSGTTGTVLSHVLDYRQVGETDQGVSDYRLGIRLRYV